jgi:hypothetical protein
MTTSLTPDGQVPPKRHADLGTVVLTSVILLGAVYLLTTTVDFPPALNKNAPGPAQWPQILLVFTIVLCALVLIGELVRYLRSSHSKAAPADQPAEQPARMKVALHELSRHGPLVAYPLLMAWLGYFVGTAAFLVAANLLVGIRNWKWIAASAVLFPVAMYLLFTALLHVELP